MDKYDLLEAMSGIRDEYIEEAAPPGAYREPAQKIVSGETAAAAASRGKEKKNPENKKAAAGKRGRLLRMQRWTAFAAALLCLSVLLPNLLPGGSTAFRNVPFLGNYLRFVSLRPQQESAFTDSDTGGEEMMSAAAEAVEESTSAGAGGGKAAADSAAEEAQEAAASAQAPAQNEMQPSGPRCMASQVFDGLTPAKEEDAVPEEEETEQEGTVAAEAEDAVRQASASAQITEEVRAAAAAEIARFEKSVEVEIGYESLRFVHEVVTDSDTWFCMKVHVCTSASDGYDQVVHFNFDKRDGTVKWLDDLFPAGSDYVSLFTENIRTQMQSRMKEDPESEYWVTPGENPEESFDSISQDQDYYINAQGDLVICFDEMEAAPLYMGTLEFTIPAEIVAGAK